MLNESKRKIDGSSTPTALLSLADENSGMEFIIVVTKLEDPVLRRGRREQHSMQEDLAMANQEANRHEAPRRSNGDR